METLRETIESTTTLEDVAAAVASNATKLDDMVNDRVTIAAAATARRVFADCMGHDYATRIATCEEKTYANEDATSDLYEQTQHLVKDLRELTTRVEQLSPRPLVACGATAPALVIVGCIATAAAVVVWVLLVG